MFNKMEKNLIKYSGLVLILFLIIQSPLEAQEAQETNELSVKLSGIVFSKDSLQALPGAHFIIENRNTGGITNKMGRFIIMAGPSDSLRFSYVGYKDSYYIVPGSLPAGDYVAAVALSRDTVLMQEVVVLSRKKNLRQELISADINPDKKTINAQRNLQIAAYQGVAGKGVEWDADMSYKQQTQKRIMRTENLGMISPDQMVALNFIALIPYTIYKLTNPDEGMQAGEVFISDVEIKRLMENYHKMIYSAAIRTDTLMLPDSSDTEK